VSRDRIAIIVVVAAAVVAGAFLRFDRINVPSYWLDEILGDELTTKAAAGPWWHWLSGIENEHGPLYYATQLLGNGRVVAALFGLATIPLIALAARRAGGGIAAVGAAAWLTAVSPLHVYYSREARPYALVMLLVTLLLIVPLRGFIATMVAMAYTSAVAAPAALAGALAWKDKRRWIALGSLVLYPLIYRGVPRSIAAAPFPRIDGEFAIEVLRAFSVSAFGNSGHLACAAGVLLLVIIGAAFSRNRMLIAMALLPALFSTIALRTFGHWFSVRYISASLPAYLVLAALGLEAIGRRPAFSLPLALIVVGAIDFDVWRAARTEAFAKVDWRAVARVLERHVRPGDAIVAAEPWADVSIRYYLRHLPPSARIAGIINPILAGVLADRTPATWIVSARPVEWMCRYPLILSGEQLRVHFAPSAHAFLTTRATTEDLRALAWQPVSIEVGRNDELYFGRGWASAEGGFRWATAREATVSLPSASPRQHVVAIHAQPAVAGERMTLSLNGTRVGDAVMHGEDDYRFPLALREGLNELTLSFDKLVVPSELDASSTDHRTLAAAVHRIALEGAPQLRVDTLRIADADVHVPVLRSRATHPLNRDDTERLLGRLGIDPIGMWPRLASGEVKLEDVVQSVAWDSWCVDDATFLTRAFAVLVERGPNAIERRDLLARMRTGATRTHIVSRIIQADDFRARMFVR
jgi:hypothetical protein